MTKTKETEWKPIKAAGGVVLKRENGELRVLMIYRRGVWDLPKGKLDKGETIEESATREVAEETGSEPPEIIAPLGTTIHRYTDKWGSFEKTTWWYVMKTKSTLFRPEKKEGIEKVCWIKIEEAIELAEFENLKDILKKVER